MTGEEFAKICFAARPVLWALAIIAVLLVAMVVVPKILKPVPESADKQQS